MLKACDKNTDSVDSEPSKYLLGRWDRWKGIVRALPQLHAGQGIVWYSCNTYLGLMGS